jgi:hypothetical protein
MGLKTQQKHPIIIIITLNSLQIQITSKKIKINSTCIKNKIIKKKQMLQINILSGEGG